MRIKLFVADGPLHSVGYRDGYWWGMVTFEDGCSRRDMRVMFPKFCWDIKRTEADINDFAARLLYRMEID